MAIPLDHDTCYAALTERNPEYEGVFYVGVRTTGVSAGRPVRRARVSAALRFVRAGPRARLASAAACRVQGRPSSMAVTLPVIVVSSNA